MWRVYVRAMSSAAPSRRPLRTREKRWAIGLAGWLAAAGVSPNAISLASIVFAALAGFCLLLTAETAGATRVLLFIAAAAGIQLRLLCNLIDGMVAVEGGRKSKSGEVFNDAPDRLADIVIFVAAGYALPGLSWGPALGWTTALLAVLTAYARLLGGAAGLAQDFVGPMAKQHRMALLTAGCILAAIETLLRGDISYMLLLALLIIAIGSAVTLARRLLRIVRALEAR
jgi:phosphatidylglycerophosphate synthase